MLNKNIIVGVTGSIAAYKSAELIRKLRAMNARVKVIMTKNAKEFITPLTLQTLAKNSVYESMFEKKIEFSFEHIDLADWADLILVAPASANFIARLAHGFADDLLTTVCLANKAKIAVAPAMNVNMWFNSATQENIKKISERGINVFGPAEGELACGVIDVGKMLEPQEIVDLATGLWAEKNMLNRKILITAGSTREAIDPVRFISNKSSGKMGYALAAAAFDAGAEVTLISGPTDIKPPRVNKLIKVTTAEEMLTAVMAEINKCEIFIAVAAVADFKPEIISTEKIKKEQQTEKMFLKLEQTIDILAAVAALPNKPFTVGFAAETDNVLENARNKLQRKKIDMIVANEVGDGLGFETDHNAVTILTKDSEPIILPLETKTRLARQILTQINAKFGLRREKC